MESLRSTTIALTEDLGEGGWGTVYRAEQISPLRREVALKIIKLGMDTKSGHHSLRGRTPGTGDDGPSEHRQSASMPARPRRPAVLRDGTGPRHPDHGVLRPDQSSVPRQRLELFIQVCQADPARPSERDHPSRHQAVERAGHAARRRSRSSRSSTSASPRRSSQRATGEHAVHGRSRQFIGTPAYMSPEQTD